MERRKLKVKERKEITEYSSYKSLLSQLQTYSSLFCSVMLDMDAANTFLIYLLVSC